MAVAWGEAGGNDEGGILDDSASELEMEALGRAGGQYRYGEAALVDGDGHDVSGF